MVRLREIQRTAAFAWSPTTSKPLLCTGTRAGAVDADFSDETKLELWDLSLDTPGQGLELQEPIASISTDSRFYDLAWGLPDAQHPQGIIAGASENGSLDLWDAEKLLKGDSDAFLSRTTKHSGPIKSLQFNPQKPQILATAGAKGELFVYDINDISNPFRLGNAAARSDDLECVAWNRKVSHILATGGSGGFVTVWDLKTKKASLTLNNNRKPVSAIAWDPNNSTKLLTSSPDDSSPVIYLWDLRNSNAPERTLQGHVQGVLSLSWCQQDSDILLSCGKDNRTLVWNPQTGELYGEFPEVTNWTFSTRFHPTNPNFSATAGFDGKITIQTLQNTNPVTSQTSSANKLDDEAFFTSAQTQPQGASFSLPTAPKWLGRPIGASFGFGGKLVIFKRASAQATTSKVTITHFAADTQVGEEVDKFEESIQKGDIQSLCESRKEQASTEEEKNTWTVLGDVLGKDPRDHVLKHLGFEKDSLLEKLASPSSENVKTPSSKPSDKEESENRNRRLSTFFADGEGEGEEDFLSNLAATKGAKTNQPFHIIQKEQDSEVDSSVTQALLLGNFEAAVTICLRENRMADAFVLANIGGQGLVDKVQAKYLASQDDGPSYLRILRSVANKNLWDVIYNADLSNWKEAIAILCTFAKAEEFADLTEALGDRLLEVDSRQDALFCFLISSKLEKIVPLWLQELEAQESAGLETPSGDTTFSVHARSLQNFVEKVTVFRKVTQFQDTEKSLQSDWKLSALYDKYTEYADIIAAQGKLSVAEKYLDLLPTHYPASDIARSRIKQATQKATTTTTTSTHSRVPAQRAPSRQPTYPGGGYQASVPAGAAAAIPTASIPTPSNPAYGTPAPSAAPTSSVPTPPNPFNPYAPSNFTPSAPAPSGVTPTPYGVASSPYAPPTSVPGPYGVPPGPPRTATPSSQPSGPPPPPKAKSNENWNDVPLVTKGPARRPTPSRTVITGPYGQTSPGTGPPPPGSQFSHTSPPPAHTSAPSPPKGPAPPPRAGSHMVSPPPQAPPLGGSGPGPAGQSAYAPPQPPVAPPMPRVASPYNVPPPNAPPPTNRYTPTPQQQQQHNNTYPGSSYHPQPAPAAPSAPKPYTPPSSAALSAPSSYAPPTQAPQTSASAYRPGPPSGPYQQQGHAQAHVSAPPRAAPAGVPPPPRSTASPASAQSPASAVATPPPAATPATPRHPAGDRSHIPVGAQRLVEILSNEMQRVASKAPESFAPQVKDTQKRLNILFDLLNNEEVVQADTISQLDELARALAEKNYAAATGIQTSIQQQKTEEGGKWIVGVKRLITMSKATP